MESVAEHPDTIARTVEELKFRDAVVRDLRLTARAKRPPPDPRITLQGFLFMDAACRVAIWSIALAAALAATAALRDWPATGPADGGVAWALHWAGAAAAFLVCFNLAYVLLLVLFRLLVPTPRPGVYSMARPPDFSTAGGRQLLYSSFVAVLTKARYEAPFPAFLVFHVSNLPPMVWLMGRVFGPRSKSCYITDPVILDPHLVEIGRNVVLGSGCNIAGHCQLPDLLVLRKTIIEDDVVIGANSTIFGGVHVQRGAMVAAGSVVPPFTIIGPCEYWSGVPAVKIRDLPPPRHLDHLHSPDSEP